MKRLIKGLKWHHQNDWCSTKSPTHSYRIHPVDDKFKVIYCKMVGHYAREATGFTTLEQAKEWAFNHHCEKLSRWLNPDPLTEYAAKFTQWATDRKIIQNGNLQTQTLKLVSEVGELADNIAKGRGTKDDIGDCFVVLNNLVEMQSYTWQECLEQAWNDIKNRTGTMNEHGVFIKDDDIG